MRIGFAIVILAIVILKIVIAIVKIVIVTVVIVMNVIVKIVIVIVMIVIVMIVLVGVFDAVEMLVSVQVALVVVDVHVLPLLRGSTKKRKSAAQRLRKKRI